MGSVKDFFRALFDISFRSLVTTKIVKLIYVLEMIAIGLTAVVFIVSAFHQSVAAGLLVLIVAAPLASLLYLIFARVWLEVVIALFRIMENTQELVERAATLSGPAPPAIAASSPAVAPPAAPSSPPPSDPLPPPS